MNSTLGRNVVALLWVKCIKCILQGPLCSLLLGFAQDHWDGEGIGLWICRVHRIQLSVLYTKPESDNQISTDWWLMALVLLMLPVPGRIEPHQLELLLFISLVLKCQYRTMSVLIPLFQFPNPKKRKKGSFHKWFSGGSKCSKRKEWLINSGEFVCGRTCLTCYPGCLSRMLCKVKTRNTHTAMPDKQIIFGSPLLWLHIRFLIFDNLTHSLNTHVVYALLLVLPRFSRWVKHNVVIDKHLSVGWDSLIVENLTNIKYIDLSISVEFSFHRPKDFGGHTQSGLCFNTVIFSIRGHF